MTALPEHPYRYLNEIFFRTPIHFFLVMYFISSIIYESAWQYIEIDLSVYVFIGGMSLVAMALQSRRYFSAFIEESGTPLCLRDLWALACGIAAIVVSVTIETVPVDEVYITIAEMVN